MTSFSILLPFLFFFFSSLTTAWVSTQSLFPSFPLLFCHLQHSEYTLTHAHKRIRHAAKLPEEMEFVFLGKEKRRVNREDNHICVLRYVVFFFFFFFFSFFPFVFFFFFGLVLTFASNRTFRAKFRIMAVCLTWED